MKVPEPPSNRLMRRCMRLLKTDDIHLHTMEPINKGSPLSMVIKTVNIDRYYIKIHFRENEKQAMLETLTAGLQYREAIRANGSVLHTRRSRGNRFKSTWTVNWRGRDRCSVTP